MRDEHGAAMILMELNADAFRMCWLLYITFVFAFATFITVQFAATDFNDNPVINRFGIGWIAGMSSTLASYPADTVRRRMQVWGKQRAVTSQEMASFGQILPMHIRTARSLFIHILREEGLRGFFKGFGVTMIKTPLSTSVSLTLNDIAKKVIFDINA